jgi:hypothetical protein
VEVGADALDELLLDQLSAALNLHLIGQLVVDVIPVLLQHQVGDLTSVEDVVDVFQEGFFQNL